MTEHCFDCFAPIAEDEAQFAVLKKARDLPGDVDPTEARLLESLTYDQKTVCGDCAGWYSDHALPMNDAAEYKARAWR